jgi:thiopurine S-methyltransferase
MEKEFWIESWNEGGFKTSFHRKDIHPYILEYLTPEKLKGKRILVPLCGKSIDLIYFQKYAKHVVGVELAEKAVYQFFEEQKLDFVKDGNRFESENLTILKADFFALSQSDIGAIDLVYDRAALVALPLPLREKYVAKMQNLLAPNAQQFVNTLEYFPSKEEPPFSISPEELQFYYGNTFEFEHLKSPLVPNHGLIRCWGLDYVKEHAFLLTKKG